MKFCSKSWAARFLELVASLSHLAGPYHSCFCSQRMTWKRFVQDQTWFCQADSPNVILNCTHRSWWSSPFKMIEMHHMSKKTVRTTSSPAHGQEERHWMQGIGKACHAPSPSSHAAPPAKVVAVDLQWGSCLCSGNSHQVGYPWLLSVELLNWLSNLPIRPYIPRICIYKYIYIYVYYVGVCP